MDWLKAKWKQLLSIAVGLLMLGGSAAYMADCKGTGDVLKQIGGFLEPISEKPVRPE
jgi:hypothetical protein